MLHYRIKIEEQYSGKKGYIPQVGYEKLTLGRYVNLYIKWENIIDDSSISSFFTSKFMSLSYHTEQEALDIVEKYKQYLQDRKDGQVKSTTYKMIE